MGGCIRQKQEHLDASLELLNNISLSLKSIFMPYLSRISILTKVCDEPTAGSVVAEISTVLQSLHTPEATQEVVSVGLAHRVVTRALHWGPTY